MKPLISSEPSAEAGPRSEYGTIVEVNHLADSGLVTEFRAIGAL
jgi:hypothetical protein